MSNKIVVVKLNHQKFAAGVQNGIYEALMDAGEFLIEETNRVVPFDEGDLADSAHTFLQSSGDVASVDVIYDTPYARVQHENEEFKHAPGRKAHYLSDTAMENEGRIRDFLVERLRKG